jgi:hypothetical protein
MGLYDTVKIPCPNCGEIYYAQSKGGECLLDVFELENAPANVLSNVNRHAPFVCTCGTSFKVENSRVINLDNPRGLW